MQQVKRRGQRLFAIPKPLDKAERIAAQTRCRGNWSSVAFQGNGTHARVIRNYK